MELNDKRFSPDMVAACAAAIDTGLQSIADIKSFVVDAIAVAPLPLQPNFIGEVVIDLASHDDFYNLQGRLQDRIAQSPRGTYAIGKMVLEGDEPTFRAYMSDGLGMAAGVKDQIFTMRPHVDEIVDKMLTHEIIECKKAIEQERRKQTDIAILKELLQGPSPLTIGRVFSQYYARGVKFESATVRAMEIENGTVDVELANPLLATTSVVTVGMLEFCSNAGIHPKAVLAQRKKDFPLLMSVRSALQADIASREGHATGDSEQPNF